MRERGVRRPGALTVAPAEPRGMMGEVKRAFIGTLVTSVVACSVGAVVGSWRVSAAYSDLGHDIVAARSTANEAKSTAENAKERVAVVEGTIRAIQAAEAERQAAILRKLDELTTEIRALRERPR